MKKYKGFKKAGCFTLTNGTKLQGELSLDGAATTLELYSESPVDSITSTDICGIFFNGEKVSLINCVEIERSRHFVKEDETPCHKISIFPHFVIFGDQYIHSSYQIIHSLSFSIDDAATIFYDFDAFGSVLNAKSYLKNILEVETSKLGREIEVGEHPNLFYFTGKYKIFKADTILGKISATHSPSLQSPGPKGIQVKNTIKINIVFDSVKDIDESVRNILDILRFIEVIAGRPQNISDLIFLPLNTKEQFILFDVYWCKPPHRNRNDGSREPHPADLPLQAAIRPDEFSNVLSHWLERNDEWRSARTRFFTAFAHQNRYTIDRIVGAANMFDILPSSIYPLTPSAPDIIEAKENTRKLFKELPVSPERDSILNALGRIGKPSLKRKVHSRVKLITDIVGDRFPELEFVTDQAINCRNYYVHGSDTKIDYSVHSNQVQFFTDTLEFVFAASDLVESGWDIFTWIKQGSTLSHPFAQYCFNYRQMLTGLKQLF